jgi:hypothetical protein
MATQADSLPNPRPERVSDGLGTRRHFSAVNARVRASLILRRLERERARHELSDTTGAAAPVWHETRRPVHARPAA